MRAAEDLQGDNSDGPSWPRPAALLGGCSSLNPKSFETPSRPGLRDPARLPMFPLGWLFFLFPPWKSQGSSLFAQRTPEGPSASTCVGFKQRLSSRDTGISGSGFLLKASGGPAGSTPGSSRLLHFPPRCRRSLLSGRRPLSLSPPQPPVSTFRQLTRLLPPLTTSTALLGSGPPPSPPLQPSLSPPPSLLHQMMSAPRAKGQFSFQSQRKAVPKNVQNNRTIALISHASKVMLKILQARLQQYVNRDLPGVQAGFRKGRGTRDQIANIHWIMEKARVPEKHLFLLY